jgi:hypothetical protein
LYQNGGLLVLSSTVETKVCWVGDGSHVVFGQKFPGGKCETVRCRDATASYFVAKFRGEVFAHFYAVALNVTAVCGIDSYN